MDLYCWTLYLLKWEIQYFQITLILIYLPSEYHPASHRKKSYPWCMLSRTFLSLVQTRSCNNNPLSNMRLHDSKYCRVQEVDLISEGRGWLCENAILRELLAIRSKVNYDKINLDGWRCSCLHDLRWCNIQLRPGITDDVSLSKLRYHSCLSFVYSGTFSCIQLLWRIEWSEII